MTTLLQPLDRMPFDGRILSHLVANLVVFPSINEIQPAVAMMLKVIHETYESVVFELIQGYLDVIVDCIFRPGDILSQ